MRARNRYLGLCLYCGAEVTRTTAPAHLRECRERQAALKSTTNKRRSVYQAEVYYLRAEATDLPEFWLDLEVRGDAQMQDLDDYLPIFRYPSARVCRAGRPRISRIFFCSGFRADKCQSFSRPRWPRTITTA